MHKGDEVPLNQRQAEYLPEQMIRTVDGYRFVDHKTLLGSREAMAGVEYSLLGMKEGGYRKVRVSPHLAYRDEGLADLIPANSVPSSNCGCANFFPAIRKWASHEKRQTTEYAGT